MNYPLEVDAATPIDPREPHRDLQKDQSHRRAARWFSWPSRKPMSGDVLLSAVSDCDPGSAVGVLLGIFRLNEDGACSTDFSARNLSL
jgi:hypothetical protein